MSWVLNKGLLGLVDTLTGRPRFQSSMQVRGKKKVLSVWTNQKKGTHFRLTSQKKYTFWSDQLEKGITFGGQMRKRQPLRVNQSEDVLG